MASRCSPSCSEVTEVGLGGDRDLRRALDLGHLVDDEAVAGAGLLVGREADRDDVDLGQRGLHQVVEPLAEQGARAVETGGVDQDQLGVVTVHDAAHDGARRLRLVGGDHHLAADQRVGQGRLAGVGPADERHEPALVLGVAHQGSLASSYSAQICSSALACRLAGPVDRAGVDGSRLALGHSAPVAHHVVRRARQLALAHQVLADRAHLRRLAGHPEVAVAGRPVDRLDGLGEPALAVTGRASQVTSAPAGR